MNYNPKQTAESFLRLVQVMKDLRGPGGCPWDAEQTPSSLIPYMIEETYEAIHAIESGDPIEICDELGDLLLQVVFQAEMFSSQGLFQIGDVCDAIANKLIRRHPHVFENLSFNDTSELFSNWDRIKQEEKEAKGASTCPLASVPPQLPALMRATKLAGKARKLGAEVAIAEKSPTTELPRDEESLGQLLLDLCQYSSQQGLDPEQALRKATELWLEDLTRQDT